MSNPTNTAIALELGPCPACGSVTPCEHDGCTLPASAGNGVIFPAPTEHIQDSHCTVNAETLLCDVCGVDHSDPCPNCEGRGFHAPTCPVMEEVAIAEAMTARGECLACGRPDAGNHLAGCSMRSR